MKLTKHFQSTHAQNRICTSYLQLIDICTQLFAGELTNQNQEYYKVNDKQKYSMGKFNCCVPNCANNWRNSPELKFHSLPRDPKVFAQYVRLIRNGNLQEFSVTDNTKICGKHFPNGERVCRTQLPTIFPWSKPVKRRRDIIKYDLPLRSMTIEDNSSTALPKDQAVLCQDNTIFSELNLNVNQQNGDLDNKEKLAQNFKPNNLTFMIHVIKKLTG